MPQARHELVFELGAVDAGAATAGTGWVTALDHEARDDAVEDDVVVLAGAGELGEVLAGLMSRSLADVSLLWMVEQRRTAYPRGLVLEQRNGDIAKRGMQDHAVGDLSAGGGLLHGRLLHGGLLHGRLLRGVLLGRDCRWSTLGRGRGRVGRRLVGRLIIIALEHLLELIHLDCCVMLTGGYGSKVVGLERVLW